MMRFTKFYQLFFRWLAIFIVGLIIFQFFRLALVLSFSSFSDLSNYKLDLFKAFFYVGFKYDTVVLCYGLLLPMLLILVSLIFKPDADRVLSFLNGFMKWFSYGIFMLCIIVLTIDFYFFKFFQSHLNLLAFGIIDDDTKAVMTSVWTDYPVIRILIYWISIAILLYIVINKISKSTFKIKTPVKILPNIPVIIVIVGLFGLGMRGSLGVFTLEKDDATISPNTFINSITMNGIFSLKDAISDYRNFAINTDIEGTLHKYGFNSKEEALNAFNQGNEPFTAITKTNDYVAKNPPHVVFFLMESMSNYYLDLSSSELNLLGELQNQKDKCIVFRNFLSVRNGTIHAIEGIMVNSPLTPLSQSPYMNTTLASAVAKPYLENGYETNFITGAKLGWRNLDKYVSHQYFNHIEGSATIIEKVAGAQTCEWGVYDEYLFERVYQILKEAKKPQFIFVLTTTNHTPYELPEHYKPYSVRIPDSLKKILRCDESIAIKNFTAYQYSNNCLGNIIKRVSADPSLKNTIIAATGDHNTVALFDFDDAHMLQKRSVPLVLYVPDPYKPLNMDRNRFGSQKDIFPTLFNLSLSNTRYFKSGNNLFDADENSTFFGLNEYNMAISKDGCVLINDGPLYFKWENNLLKPTNLKETPGLEELLNTAKGYAALITIHIQEQLLKKK